MSKPLNIALAGAGAFGQKHLDALKLIDGVKVTSVIGRELDKTKEVAAKYGIGHVATSLEVADQPGCVRSTRDLELQLGHRLAPRSTRDIGDVRAMTEDGLGEAIQDTWLVAALNQQARNV